MIIYLKKLENTKLTQINQFSKYEKSLFPKITAEFHVFQVSVGKKRTGWRGWVEPIISRDAAEKRRRDEMGRLSNYIY